MHKVLSLVIILHLVGAASIFAQAGPVFDLTIITEGVDKVSKTTDLIIDDPSLDIPESGTEEDKEEAAAGGISIGITAEMEISPSTKSFKVPIDFTYQRVTIGLSTPIIFNRTMRYTGKTAEASGIGDISMTVGYPYTLQGISMLGTISLKLPTGDAKAMDDTYLVPLGTGSTDLALGLNAVYTIASRQSVIADVMFRMNGSDEKITEVLDQNNNLFLTNNYDVHNGNIFMLQSSYNYQFKPRLNGLFGLSVMIMGEGETELTSKFNADNRTTTSVYSNEQDLFLLELIPEVQYKLSIFLAKASLTVPLVTSRNENNTEESRSITFKTGITYKF